MKDYFFETENEGQMTDTLALNPKTEASNHIIRHLEMLFPGRVILWCSETHEHWLYTENSATFFGFTPEELATKTYYDYRALIHPDDLTGYDLACRKIKQIKQELNPADWGQYRFVMHYRVWRKTEYFQLREEQIFQSPGQKPGGHHALLTNVQDDYPFTCVQLDWYKVGPLGYNKINSYTPQNQDSALSEENLRYFACSLKDSTANKSPNICLSASIRCVITGPTCCAKPIHITLRRL